MNLVGKCLIRREIPAFSFARCDQTVAPFDTLSASLESSPQALKWVSVIFSCFDTSPGHIFSLKGLFTSPPNWISSLTTLVLGAPLCLLTCLCLCWFSSWDTLLYSCFYGPPLDLYCVAAPSSRPCLEHPSWVIITFMESIPSPFVSHHPSSLGPSLVSHIMAFSPTVPYPSWYCVSRCQVIHALML